jgi:hypothetical protein
MYGVKVTAWAKKLYRDLTCKFNYFYITELKKKS